MPGQVVAKQYIIVFKRNDAVVQLLLAEVQTLIESYPRHDGQLVVVTDIAKCAIEDIGQSQGGITCGAIDEPRKSSKAIDERVIINFRDKNVAITRFRNKNVVIARFRDKNVVIAQ